jgi:4a-hydroxytetrahydrobiopterin dehydratase
MMSDLAILHCVQVTSGSPHLDKQEISRLLLQIPEWHVYEKEGEPRVERVFKFKDFNEAMEFSNRVANIANTENHHPALLTEWGKVTVTWWTHATRALHMNDFIMAAKTDTLLK